jgi:NADH-quinone oxidoreductase subunit I
MPETPDSPMPAPGTPPSAPSPDSPMPAPGTPPSAPSSGESTAGALLPALNVTAWSPGEDVIEVTRHPMPGAARSAWRTFRETARGLRTTFARIREEPSTVQYPEEKVPVYPRFRGRHKLHRFEDSGLEKCVGCSLCAAACPADCIRVVAEENTPENRVSPGERYAAVYEINLSRCIFCGYCEIACPFDAITMGHDYELSDYDRHDLIFTKEMLLAEPLERTPLRNEGE